MQTYTIFEYDRTFGSGRYVQRAAYSGDIVWPLIAKYGYKFDDPNRTVKAAVRHHCDKTNTAEGTFLVHYTLSNYPKAAIAMISVTAPPPTEPIVGVVHPND
jgi:hypothetical protein